MADTVAQPMLSASEWTHRAKRFNEGVKLTATVFNGTAILTLGTAFITPLVQHPTDVLTNSGWAFLLAALLLHLIGQIALRLFLRAEEERHATDLCSPDLGRRVGAGPRRLVRRRTDLRPQYAQARSAAGRLGPPLGLHA